MLLNQEQGRATAFTATPDQEAWVRTRISNAVRMGAALELQRGSAATDLPFKLALAGIIDGTAIEIIKTLGGEPCYVNLPPPPGIPRPPERVQALALNRALRGAKQ